MNWCGKNSFGIGTRPLQTEMRNRRECLTFVRRGGHGLSFRVSYLISFWGGKMIFKSSFLLLTVWARVSRLQIPFFEFLRRRAEVAEVVNGRASRGEGERLERFREHLVEVFPRGEAGGDVRMIILAGMLRHELRNVGDQGREDLGIFGRRDECGRGSGFHRERGHSVNHLLFQLEQFRSRFDDNAREAKVLVRYVVVFESFQLQASQIGAGGDFADGGIDFIQILGEDETLHQGDVGTVGGIERKAFRKTLSRRLLVAAACWSIVASGFSRMSMAVTEASAGIGMARAHAIDPLSQSRVEVVVFIVVSFRFVLVIGLLKAATLHRLTVKLTGPPPLACGRRNNVPGGSG
jgi:hypothetical protein